MESSVSRKLFFTCFLTGLLFIGCRKEVQSVVFRYEITSSLSNSYRVTYRNDLDVEQGTITPITVQGGYWTANHIGKKNEPYYISVEHDTSSKPPYSFQLFIIANDDTLDSYSDTLRFEKITLKGKMD